MPESFADHPAISPEQEKSAFQQFFRTHRAPLLNFHAAYRIADADVKTFKDRVKSLKELEKTPARDRELGWMQKYYELHCWRALRFHDLPDDILLYIFRLGTLNSPDDWKSPFKPLFYSSICRRWRRLAMSRKATWLWSSIRFDEVPPFTLTKEYLRLSRDAPLTIEFDITDVKFDHNFNDYWATAHHLSDRLKVLVPYINRWQKLYLRADNWAPIYGALRFLEDLDAPSLETIILKQNFEHLHLDPIRDHLPLFRSTPALKVLALTSVPIRYDIFARQRYSLRELRLEKLLKNRNDMPAVSDFLGILRNSSNLEILVLDSAGPQWNDRIARMLGPASLPMLREFTLLGSKFPAAGRFASIKYFSFVLALLQPGQRLTCLDLCINQGSECIIPWFRAYCRNAQHVTFRNTGMSISEIARWLGEFPEVTRITVTNDALQSNMFTALCVPAHRNSVSIAGNVLCPSLKQIVPCNVVPIGPKLSLIRRRRALHCPLTTIIWPTSLKRKALESFGQYRDFIRFEYKADEDGPTDKWIGPDPCVFTQIPEGISDEETM